MAMRMVADKLRGLPDFPPQLRVLVEHMILSHHGRLEFGSPKLPQFPEALLLHYLDDMDSKMECMRALIQKDRQVDGMYTGYCAPLERTVLKKARYLGGEPAAPRGRAARLRARGRRQPGGRPEPRHPQPSLFGGPPPKSGSLFGEKLKQALRPADIEK